MLIYISKSPHAEAVRPAAYYQAIADEVKTFPNTLRSLPGVGPVYAAGILSEIQDISRFSSDDQLAKMAARGVVPRDDKWREDYKEPAKPVTESLPELPEGWCSATLESITTIQLGKMPVEVNDAPGFVSNRILIQSGSAVGVLGEVGQSALRFRR